MRHHRWRLQRVRRIPPLKGMNALQLRKIVAGTFKVRDRAALSAKP